MVNKGVIAGIGAIAAVGIAAGTYALWPASSAPTPTPAPTPATFDLQGTVTLTSVDVVYETGRHGEECHGRNGFKDMNAGAEVTVYGANDTVIGTGQLEQGVWFDSCVFRFTVPSVPETRFFEVQVSHRGRVAFSMDDVRAMKVALQLGP